MPPLRGMTRDRAGGSKANAPKGGGGAGVTCGVSTHVTHWHARGGVRFLPHASSFQCNGQRLLRSASQGVSFRVASKPTCSAHGMQSLPEAVHRIRQGSAVVLHPSHAVGMSRWSAKACRFISRALTLFSRRSGETLAFACWASAVVHFVGMRVSRVVTGSVAPCVQTDNACFALLRKACPLG